MSFHNHICGCYFVVNYQRKYLPQVQTVSHTTINPVSFTTQLTQTFSNPNSEAVSQARYTFPLYDGVAVNGYKIVYGDKTLTGIVQQQDTAKQTYQAAVDRGETAGLLESLPVGVFGVTIGNVPAKTDITVDITYCGELKHDASIDGLRYMLPTSIAPRYGSYPGELLQSNTTAKGGMSITVDVDMGKSAIRKVQSPSHPIAMTMGELSTATKSEGSTSPFSPSQASATLTQGTTELAGDFVLQLLIDDISKPQAILEVHPTLPGQRAIMSTLVPKFVLETAHPEIVFIADQSGSMSGSKNTALVAALKVFLKSLPVGVRFNICAFGNRYEFLWPKSQAYSEANVKMALSFVDTLSAQYGGTEIYEPIKATFERHLKDLPLEVMLLTDGEVWQEGQVFELINEQIKDKKVDARVFALGIGQDVSHTLVEGVARAGNGFAQFVTQNEETDQKVIRMLKGALYAHTKEYSLEVHYEDDQTMNEDDGFEIVEKVNDCLVIEDQGSKSEQPPPAKKAKSFFDTSVDLDEKPKTEDRYAHLPPVDTPKIVQAPATIPPLFPFNRTTAYLLLGPETSQKNVKSVTLRAQSSEGPLELNVSIQGSQTGTSIHQLAARKAIQDLEEGRGWLQSATTKNADGDNVLVKKKYESRFDEMVEREGVRLGERFQVSSKWTSFVAVEDHSNEAVTIEQEAQVSAPPTRSANRFQAPVQGHSNSAVFSSLALPSATASMQRVGVTKKSKMQPRMQQMGSSGTGGGLFGHAATPAAATSSSGSSLFGSSNAIQGAAFAMPSQQQNMMMAQRPPAPSGGPPPPPARKNNMFEASEVHKFAGAAAAAASADDDTLYEEAEASDEDMGFGLFGDGPEQVAENLSQARGPRKSAPSATFVPPAGQDMHKLIGLQTFSGAWPWDTDLFNVVGIKETEVDQAKLGGDSTVAATLLAVAYLETKLAEKKDVWEMVVSKARAWLDQQLGAGSKTIELLVEAAKYLKDVES